MNSRRICGTSSLEEGICWKEEIFQFPKELLREPQTKTLVRIRQETLKQVSERVREGAAVERLEKVLKESTEELLKNSDQNEFLDEFKKKKRKFCMEEF